MAFGPDEGENGFTASSSSIVNIVSQATREFNRNRKPDEDELLQHCYFLAADNTEDDEQAVRLVSVVAYRLHMKNSDSWTVLETVLWWTWNAAVLLAALSTEACTQIMETIAKKLAPHLKVDEQVAAVWASVLQKKWDKLESLQDLAEEVDTVVFEGSQTNAAAAAGVLRANKGGGKNVAKKAAEKTEAILEAVKAAKASDPTARGRGSSNRQKALRRQFFVDDADEDADGILRWKIPKLAWHRLCREVLDELGARLALTPRQRFHLAHRCRKRDGPAFSPMVKRSPNTGSAALYILKTCSLRFPYAAPGATCPLQAPRGIPLRPAQGAFICTSHDADIPPK